MRRVGSQAETAGKKSMDFFGWQGERRRIASYATTSNAARWKKTRFIPVDSA
jgi:hypothetical protein